MTRLSRLVCTLTLVGAIALVGALASACGSSGPSRPGPLKHKFDEVMLDALSMEKKEEMFKAQNEFTRARAAHRKGEADLAEGKSMLQIAKNELAQAKISEKSAGERKKTAEASNDMNKINPAMKEARVAELDRRAADEKISARNAEIKHFKLVELYAAEEMYHQEARFEQTKARLAKDNNIKPKDFSYEKYEKQAQNRSQRAQKAKLVADREASKAEAAKKKYEKALEQVEAAKGSS